MFSRSICIAVNGGRLFFFMAESLFIWIFFVSIYFVEPLQLSHLLVTVTVCVVYLRPFTLNLFASLNWKCVLWIAYCEPFFPQNAIWLSLPFTGVCNQFIDSVIIQMIGFICAILLFDFYMSFCSSILPLLLSLVLNWHFLLLF